MIRTVKQKEHCVLCSGTGQWDSGLILGWRTPGTYDPCPICEAREQRDNLRYALLRAEQTFRNLAADGSIVTMGTSLEIAKNEISNMRVALGLEKR